MTDKRQLSTAWGSHPSGDGLPRCAWVSSLVSYPYHDREWGVPVHDDRTLFEMLLLEGAQAGLSWETILKKRDGYRLAFDNFEASIIASYGQEKIDSLLEDSGIIRNRLKIGASVQNARSFLAVQESYGSFDAYLWSFIGGSPRINAWRSMDEVPAHTAESEAMRKDLKSRGFKFVGSTICYALMQSLGMVNDHTTDCFRYSQINEMGRGQD